MEKSEIEIFRAEWITKNSETFRKNALEKMVRLSSSKFGRNQDAFHQIIGR